MTIAVKICGLSDASAVAAAVEGRADFVGFVFFSASPRSVSPETAMRLGANVPSSIVKVGLVVDADDAMLTRIVERARIDMLQLHGGESPARAAEIRARFGLPVMKAIGIETAADVDKARDFEPVVDRLMFDARPPKDATRPGGNAAPFDWTLLKGHAFAKPWLLAGGLSAANVAEAVRASGAKGVDVSSGVETAPGRKGPEKIREFLRVAKAL
jgi:phosphoribosylanthranilate isomerase